MIPSARARIGAMALTALLGACSPAAGGEAAKRPTSGPAPAIPHSTIAYVAIGASETIGIGARQVTADAWPQVFYRTALPLSAVYYNFGVSGDTVAGALVDQVPEALSVQPTLVTVWLNVNDLLAGVPAAQYRGELQQLVHDLRRGGTARVMVANTPYLDRLPAFLACHQGQPAQCVSPTAASLSATDLNTLVDAYNAAIAGVVATEGATLVDLHARGETPTAHPDWVSADGFHPSTAGHAAVAALFAERYRMLGRP